MNGFTSKRETCDFPSPEIVSFRKVRIDSKGRISIPSDIRKSIGLEFGSNALLGFDLKRGIIFIICGQDGVAVSIRACGALGPGSNPGPDPYDSEGIDEDG